MLTRREFLWRSAAALALRQPGKLIGTVPFEGAAEAPLGRLIGQGLDARLFTDLSTLVPTDPVTPVENFYIRTARPDRLDRSRRWTIEVHGLVAKRVEIDAAELAAKARPLGAYLMECAGNSNPRDFGLMSVARWSGVPLTDVLARVERGPRAARILVSGFDEHSTPSTSSVPGASWIFAPQDLDRAFLATGMNDAPLTADHGAPVRLVVPRWYGCACIKWVNGIELVPDDVAATPQMQEFANRTHQAPGVRLAREFTPATIEVAAMPVRVEKWLTGSRGPRAGGRGLEAGGRGPGAGKLEYRVVGIVWGGSKPTNALEIRFSAREPWVPVEACPMPATTDVWSFWSHTWRPQRPGRHQIVLRVSDPAIDARRLGLYFYTREVRIDEI